MTRSLLQRISALYIHRAFSRSRTSREPLHSFPNASNVFYILYFTGHVRWSQFRWTTYIHRAFSRSHSSCEPLHTFPNASNIFYILYSTRHVRRLKFRRTRVFDSWGCVFKKPVIVLPFQPPTLGSRAPACHLFLDLGLCRLCFDRVDVGH